MNCHHSQYESRLHADECAECLREEVRRWRRCAVRLRPFAASYATHPKRNPEDKLWQVLAEFDALTKTPLTK